MSKDVLLALINDVDRLLAAGASSTGNDERLKKRGQTLRELSQKVLALKPVADTIAKVTVVDNAQVGNSFLDLVLMSRQLRSGLSNAGLEGGLLPVAPSGPWQTESAVCDVYPLHEALSTPGKGRTEKGRAGLQRSRRRNGKSAIEERAEKVREGLQRQVAEDLRLVSDLLKALDDSVLAEVVAVQVFSLWAKVVRPELIPILIREIKDCRWGLRQQALQALRCFSPEHQELALPAVLLIASNEFLPVAVRHEAFLLLPAHMDRHPQSILPVLRYALKEKYDDVRAAVHEAIAAIGPPARGLLRDFLESTRTQRHFLMDHDLVRKVDPEGTMVVPFLCELLRARPRGDVWPILEVLQSYGPRARPAIPAVKQLLATVKEQSLQDWGQTFLSALEGP